MGVPSLLLGEREAGVDGECEDEGEGTGVRKWIIYLGRAAGIITSIACMFFGAWASFTIFPVCIVAGCCQVLLGLAMLFTEACLCCLCSFPPRVEKRLLWQKSLVYFLLSWPPPLLCFSLTTLIPGVTMVITALIYIVLYCLTSQTSTNQAVVDVELDRDAVKDVKEM